MKIQMFTNYDDGDNLLYEKAISKRMTKLEDVTFTIKRFEENHKGTIYVDCPTIVVRPFPHKLKFIKPEFDLEGYHTGRYVPPVVNAIIEHLGNIGKLYETDEFIVVGSGIGSYLMLALTLLGFQTSHIHH